MYVKGPWTGADLSEAASLFRQREGASGDSAPNLAPHSLQLSYELAAAAYTMDQAVWHQAGWQDFSLIVNGSLMTGAALNSGDTPLNDLTRATLQTLARLKKSALNPIGQYMGLRQAEEETESLKAIVMLLPQDGLYIVAVGFMGTGKQLGDWTPNFRMEEEAGLHEGFLQLSQEFENQLEHITFTHAAGLLGRDSLTLQDVIGELKRPGSIFRLWISGHSQGAAVMQVFVDRLLAAGVEGRYLPPSNPG